MQYFTAAVDNGLTYKRAHKYLYHIKTEQHYNENIYSIYTYICYKSTQRMVILRDDMGL